MSTRILSATALTAVMTAGIVAWTLGVVVLVGAGMTLVQTMTNASSLWASLR